MPPAWFYILLINASERTWVLKFGRNSAEFFRTMLFLFNAIIMIQFYAANDKFYVFKFNHQGCLS